MKTQNYFFRIFLLFMALFFAKNTSISAQDRVAVLNIYTNLPAYNSTIMGNIFRIQLAKHSKYSVIDRWDMNAIITDKKINPECNSKLCLLEIGKTIGADKMLTGSVECFGRSSIMITLRLLDVDSLKTVNTIVIDFIYNPVELISMIDVSMKELLGLEVDPDLKRKLTDKNDFGSKKNTRSGRLNASGPRIGVSVLSGTHAERFGEPLQNGGFDGYPAMFQFGYQLEAQYLNEGSFQALFEFIPMISGLDQGLFIPSFTLMNGLRNNRNGWEFAFGPTIVLNKMAKGYYENEEWHLASEWTDSIPNPNFLITRMDSRGEYKITTGFVFAFGKTFKSGNLNIPVNLYAIPSKEGIRFGASFGYNSKN